MKLKRQIAFLTVLIIIINMFSPYSLLFNNTVEASTGTLEEFPMIINNLGIQTKGANKVLTLELAYVSEETVAGFDLKFKVDTSKITPCNKNNGNATPMFAFMFTQSAYYQGTLQVKSYDSSTNTFTFTANEPSGGFNAADSGFVPGMVGDPNIDDNGDGYPAYYPIGTLTFKVMDSSITDASQIALSDIIQLEPDGYALPTGLQVGYYNGSNIKVYSNVEIAGNGFATPSKTVDSISVKKSPDTVNYEHGTAINLTGGIITVTYSDNTSEDVNMTDSSVTIKSGSPANVSNPTVTVSYSGKEASFPITVTDPVVSLSATPMTKTEYNHNDSLDFTGVTLTATRKSTATETLTPTSTGVSVSETVASVDSAKFTQTSPEGVTPVKGTQIITYSYEGKTANQTIIVNDRVQSINLTTQPTKQIYRRDELLDQSGAVVEVTLESGNKTTINLPDSSITIGSYSKTLTGSQQNLSVKLGDKTSPTTMNVEVYDYITAATLINPTKTIYKYNDSLSVAGGKLKLNWKSGSIQDVDLTTAMVSGFSGTTLGTQTLTVTYNTKYTLSDATEIPETITKTYQVEVTNPVKTIAITKPDKTTYRHGDALDFTGASILVTYEDNTTSNPAMSSATITEADGSALNMSPAASTYTNDTQTKNLKIKYEEDGKSETIDYPITLNNYVTGIAVTTQPTKTTYNVNDTTYDLAGGVVTISKAAGDSETVALGDSRFTITPALNTLTGTTGTKTVNVAYGTFSDTFTISVADGVTGVAITVPSKTEYKHGESIDLTGGNIKLSHASGTDSDVAISNATITELDGSPLSMSPVSTDYDSNHKYHKQVKITYTDTASGKTDTKVYEFDIINDLRKIEINPKPTKDKYNVNESLDVSGGQIIITRAVGATETKDITADMVSGFDSSTESTNLPLTVSYTENGITETDTYDVSVQDQVISIAVKTQPKLNYKYNEALDLSSGVLEVTRGSGKTDEPMTNASASGYDPTTLGNQPVTLTLSGKTVEITVNVKDYVTGIAISPTSINGIYGATLASLLTTNNAKYVVTYAKAGDKPAVNLPDTMVGGYNANSTITQNLTVTYTDNDTDSFTNGQNFIDTLTINLANSVTDVAITVPTKTSYNHGEALDLSTGKITLTHADNTPEDIALSNATITEVDGSPVNMSPDADAYDSTTHKLSKTVKITYTDSDTGKTDTKDYTFDLINDLQSITIHTMPTKTSYNINEPLDVSPGEIKIHRATGNDSIIPMTTDMISGFVNTVESLSLPLTVSYTENGITETDTYNVSVQDQVISIAVKTQPKLNYKYNEDLDLSSGVLTVTRGSGATDETMTIATPTGYDKTVLGDQTVTLAYGGQTATITVNVKDYVTGIVVNPSSVSGDLGDTLASLISSNSIVYKVTYAKAGEQTGVTLPESMVTTAYNDSLTTQALTVTYVDNDNDSFTKDQTFTATLNVGLSNTVTGVTITVPTKSTYNHGEALDLSTATVTLTYADGNSVAGDPSSIVAEELTGGAVNMSPAAGDYDSAYRYNKTIKLTYTDATSGKTDTKNYTFDIINDLKSISMYTTPKNVYNIGESLDVTNGEIKATRAVGTDSIIALTPSMVSGFSSSSNVASLPLTVKYTENGIDQTTTYNVAVADSITSMTVKTQPKLNYKYNEELDLSTGVLEVVKGSGTVEVPMTDAVASGYDKEVLGDQTVTLTYGGESVTITVNVKDYVTGIAVDPSSVSGTLGDTLASLISTKNIVYKVTYAKAGEQTGVSLPEAMVTTAYNDNTASQALTITYVDNDENSFTKDDSFTATLNVSLSNNVTGVAITVPSKTEYKHGEGLDLSDASITLTYEDGTTSAGNVSDLVVTESDGVTPVSMTPDASDYDASYKFNKTIKLKYTDTASGTTDTEDYTFDIINDVKSITVHTNPDKLAYNIGESLDVTNGEIKVTRAVGTDSILPMTPSMVTGLDTTAEHTTLPLTVSYTENGVTETASYDVSVQDSIISMVIKTLPKQDYKYNEELDLSSGVITVTRGSGDTDIPMSSATPTGYDKETLGDQTVTITYAGESKTFTVNVKDYVTGITVDPSSVNGTLGDTLSSLLTTNNVVYKVTYAKAGEQTGVSLPEAMITTTYDPNETTQTLDVEYTDSDANSFTNGTKFNSSLTVGLSNVVTGVTITAPTKAEYKHGESLDLSDATITLTYADGNTATGNVSDLVATEADGVTSVSMTPNASDYDAAYRYNKTVKLKYTDTASGISDTKDYTFDIINDIQSISMHTQPTKLTYNVGETLDVTDGEIEVTRAVGIPTIEALTPSMVSGFDSTAEYTNLPLTVEYTENGITKGTSYDVSVQDSVTSIAIKTLPKQDYKYDEALDLSSGVITITKGSGSEDKPMTLATASGYDPQTLGNQTVTLTYGGQEATFQVNVKDYVTGITVTPNTVDAVYGKSLAEVIADNSIEYVVTYAKAGDIAATPLLVSMLNASIYNAQDVDNAQSLTVTYTDSDANSFTNGTDFTANLTLTVKDDVTSITLVGTPKTSYEYDDPFDITGLELQVVRPSGTQNIPLTDSNVVGYDPHVIGNQTVDIVYNGQTVTQINVEVTNPITGIGIGTMPKQDYILNDSLDVTDGTIVVTKKNGDTETIPMTPSMVSGFDSSVENLNQELTVTHEGFTTTYNVSIIEPVSSISMNTLPKTNYNYGESLDVTDGKINVLKVSGTTTVVDLSLATVTELDGTPFDSTNMTARDLLVTYAGQTTTYGITVTDNVASVTLSGPSKTTYEYDEDLDLSDANLVVTTASGATQTIPVAGNSDVSVTGYDKQHVGAQTVTVNYTDPNGEQHAVTFPVVVEDNITGITMGTTPKQDYKYGESLDVTNGTLIATRTSGATENIPMTPSMVSGFDANSLGTENLTVTYNGFTASYSVTVEDFVDSIELTEPSKKVYELNEPIDLTGGLITEIMASGAAGNVESITEAMISGFNTTTLGAKLVVVSYTDSEGNAHQKTFGITVVDSISDIVLDSVPDKTVYKYNEPIDLTGARLKVTRNSSAVEYIPVTSSMISGYSPVTLGNQLITVSYEGYEAEFYVTVEDYVVGLRLTEPDKTVYEYGENLDLTGGEVEIVTASGAVEESADLTASMLTTPFDNKDVGTQTLNVSFKGFIATFDVEVQDSTYGIVLYTNPNKTVYEYGEELDVTGATIKVTKSSGTTIVPVTDDMVSGFIPTKVGVQSVQVEYDGFEASIMVRVKERVQVEPEEPEDEPEDEPETPVRPVQQTTKIVYVPTTTTPVKEDPKPQTNTVNTNTVNTNTVNTNTTNTMKNTTNTTNTVKNNTVNNTNTQNTKVETLGVKDEKDDNKLNMKALIGLLLAIILLLIIILTRKNTKIYVEEDKEFVLGGVDKLNKKNPYLNVDKYLDEETRNNRVKIVLNDSISEDLDGKEIEIKFRGYTIKHKVKYDDKPYEFILE